jgi:hypothetical protein
MRAMNSARLMQRIKLGLISAVLALTASLRAVCAETNEPTVIGAPPHPFVYAAEGCAKILRFGANGRVDWEYPAPMARDVWVLSNGNVLFPYNENYSGQRHDNPSGVIEVTPDKKVVFHFRTTGQVFSCQRMADGNTLVGAASQGKLLIVNSRAELVREIRVLNALGHSCLRNVRETSAGTFLAAEESAKVAREYSPDGRLLREFKCAFPPYSVVRLTNDHTLVCGAQGMTEFDADARAIWSVAGKDCPEAGLRWFAGVQVLPDGGIFVCNAGGKVPFFVLGPDRRVRWLSATGSSSATPVPVGHGIQLLGLPGTALK